MNDEYKTLGQIITEPATQFGSRELDSGNPHAWSAEKERQFEQDISDVQRNYTVTTADLQAYAYPDNIVTAMILDRLAGYGSEFGIRDLEFIKKMDAGQEIYGGGALISDIMAERVKAERVKAERVKIKVELSERERDDTPDWRKGGYSMIGKKAEKVVG